MLVDAHGHIDRFRSVLIAHKDAVFSGICHVDVIDGDGAALGLLSDDKLVLVSDLLVVAQPRDLWGWFAVDEACQAQRLERGRGNSQGIMTCKKDTVRPPTTQNDDDNTTT